MAGKLHDPAELIHSKSEMEHPSPPAGLLLTGHFLETDAYHVHRSAGTRDWLLMYTLGGRGRVRLGDYTKSCETQSAIILCPGTPHDYGTFPHETWEFLWAHFVPRDHASRWLRLAEERPGLMSVEVQDEATHRRLVEVFDRVQRDERAFGTYREELALHALEEMFILFSQENERKRRPRFDPRIEDVLAILTTRYQEPLRLDDLAKTVSLSPSRLAHLFKNQVGDSIIETLLRLRLRQAARLLEFTSRSVSDIALDVGFHSLYYFSRQFRTFYGLNPSAYRRRAHGALHQGEVTPLSYGKGDV